MGTTVELTDRVYGDWEWDHDADKPGNIYPARITSWWSGGCEFVTDRATLERIVAAQETIRKLCDFPEDLATMRWDGDVMVLTEVDGTEYRFDAGPDGLYACGFGWTWDKWTDDDETGGE